MEITPGFISPSDILTVQELASRLKVKPTWVYEKMRGRGANPLPVFKIGRYLRFSWADVCAWLQSTRKGGTISKKPPSRAAIVRKLNAGVA